MKEEVRTVFWASRRRGLTLVELLVVLTILALMATVAITSTGLIMSQGRYDATVRTLEAIRTAMVDEGTGTSSPAITGFASDIGRLPESLDELLHQPTGIANHTVWTFDSDSDDEDDIWLACGWRGPYLRLVSGQTMLLDGWGRSFGFASADGFVTITSLGSDGDFDLPEDAYAPSKGAYDRDVDIQIEPADYSASLVTFHVRELATSGHEVDPSLEPGERLILRLYAVDRETGQAVEMPRDVNEITFQHALKDVVVGTLAVRALVLDGSNNIKKKSAPSYLTVRPRTNLYQKLIVR